MPMIEIGDKVYVINHALFPGKIIMMDRVCLDFARFGIQDYDPRPTVPYDRDKVPEGHEPRLMLSDNVDLTWSFRVKTNNWLIDTFGTRPAFKFTNYLRYGMPTTKGPAGVFAADITA